MKSECFKSHWCQAYKWVRDTKTSKVRKRLLDSTEMSKVKELVAPAGSHFQSFETSICTAAAHAVTATAVLASISHHFGTVPIESIRDLYDELNDLAGKIESWILAVSQSRESFVRDHRKGENFVF